MAGIDHADVRISLAKRAYGRIDLSQSLALIFPPGHAQVAVELWPNSGEYYLIETTIMPVDGENVNSVVTYKTQQEWLDYIQHGYGDGSGGCYVLNCGLATALGLLPLTN